MTTLPIEKRDTATTNVDALRAKGIMPAVFYGKKEASTPISIAQRDFIKAWNEAGESSVIVLKNSDGKDLEALICDVDVDPVNGNPRHADFYVFEKGHKIEVSTPLEFIGVSPAVKEKNGVLVKVLHELKIEAQSKDLPSEIEVDISALVDFDSQITAEDINLPSGVTLLEDPEEVVALVSKPKEEEPEESEETPDIADIEVEKKGKEESADEEVDDAKE